MRPATREASSSSSGRPRTSHKATPTRKLASPPDPKAEGVLYLHQNEAKFSAPSRRESVFFDECNREIISLTTGPELANKTRVVFQKTNRNESIDFLLPVEKRILSIKLNASRTVLAYHAERNVIEFINVIQESNPDGTIKYSLDSKRYVQSSRAKNSKLIGFLWTGPTDLVIITDLSVEYYTVITNRYRLNLVKTFESATNWFVYQPTSDKSSGLSEELKQEEYSILMVSTGSLGNLMQPYMFVGGRVVKLQRFEVEGSWHDSEKLKLIERSITIAFIYGHVRLLVLQHESLNVKSKGAQIVLYTVDPESGATSKTHTLDLDVNGRFAINILDNLVIAHDQPSKTSSIFDIMIQSTEKSDCPNHFVSLISSLPIRSLTLKDDRPVEMYSLNWVFFQPNFIVDAKLGLLTTLQLDLGRIQDILQDNNLVLNFLAHRTNAESIVLAKCKQIVDDAYLQLTTRNSSSALVSSPLAEVSSAFEILGKLVTSAPELVTGPSRASTISTKSGQFDGDTSTTSATSGAPLRLDCIEASIYQEDVKREVFRGFDSDELNQTARYHFVSSTLLEFLFVVRRHEKNVEFCIYELLLRCMMRAKRHFQVIQMIRSEIFKDSKQLACLLLSLKDQYRPAGQLGLDMFHRLPGGLPANLPAELVQEY